MRCTPQQTEKMMKTYLTKTIWTPQGNTTIVYYVCPNLGVCHVAYYTE